MTEINRKGKEVPIIPFAKPRGIPKDATFLTKFDANRWGVDGHSHSYLTGRELHNLDIWIRRQKWTHWKTGFEINSADLFGYVFGSYLGTPYGYPGDSPEGLEKVRLVFWFDN